MAEQIRPRDGRSNGSIRPLNSSSSFFVGQSARQRGYVHLSWPMQRLMRCLYRPNPQGRDVPYDVPVHQSTKVELIVDGQVRTLTPIRARLCELAAIRRRFGLSTASHPSGPQGDGHDATGEVFARTAIQPYPPVALRAMRPVSDLHLEASAGNVVLVRGRL
jgi:hypothetical protein